MAFKNVKHSGASAKALVLAAAIVLMTALLVSCGGQASSSASASGSAASGSAAAASSQAASATASQDFTTWKTLGDAIAVQGDAMSATWNDEYYVRVIQMGDTVVRVVAKLTPEASKAVNEDIDWSRDDVTSQIENAVGSLALERVDDFTGERLSQADMDGLAGKTGQDLIDAGWTFNRYFMYGGEQTIAVFDKGNLAYAFTFDATVPEDKTEDGGASLTQAVVASVEYEGASSAATDLDAIARSFAE